MLERVDKLRELLDEGEGAFISGKANIFYYSGFTSEDARLIITHDRRILLTDSRYTVQAKNQSPDFDIVKIQKDYNDILSQSGVKYICCEEENLTLAEFSKLEKSNLEILKKQDIISSPRMVKSDDEIKKLREAERLGDEAFKYMLGRIKSGRTEKEIALELEFFMRNNGASGLSFETISASGERSAMPHGTASDRIIQRGDFVTLDFGCVFENYCSDMTRTVVMGNPAQWQREVYDVTLSAQRAALNALEPGKTGAEIDAVARKIISDAGYGKNFGHGLGHGVGVEIHELPSLSPAYNKKLRTGNTVTVEPGIYLEGMGGVRIEDLTILTESGYENLTKSSKELIIL